MDGWWVTRESKTDTIKRAKDAVCVFGVGWGGVAS